MPAGYVIFIQLYISISIVGNEDIGCELWLNQGFSGNSDVFVNVANKVVRECGLVKAMTFTDHNDDMVSIQYLF